MQCMDRNVASLPAKFGTGQASTEAKFAIIIPNNVLMVEPLVKFKQLPWVVVDYKSKAIDTILITSTLPR